MFRTERSVRLNGVMVSPLMTIVIARDASKRVDSFTMIYKHTLNFHCINYSHDYQYNVFKFGFNCLRERVLTNTMLLQYARTKSAARRTINKLGHVRMDASRFEQKDGQPRKNMLCTLLNHQWCLQCQTLCFLLK